MSANKSDVEHAGGLHSFCLQSWNGEVSVDDVLLRHFRRRLVAILSPHFDDACFSIGGFLEKLGIGHLVNIFTQGTHIAAGSRGRSRRGPLDVYRLRDAEDAAFALRCGLIRHDLDCDEPSLRGRRPSELHHVEDDLDQISLPLMTVLSGLTAGLPPNARGALFVPLGAGRHVNHRAVSMFAFRHRTELEKRYDLFFYEDLPYASNPWARQRALMRARQFVSLRARCVLSPDWRCKSDLVRLYPSQLKTAPRRLAYRPGSLNPFGPHEAFWSAFSIKSTREV